MEADSRQRTNKNERPAICWGFAGGGGVLTQYFIIRWIHFLSLCAGGMIIKTVSGFPAAGKEQSSRATSDLTVIYIFYIYVIYYKIINKFVFVCKIWCLCFYSEKWLALNSWQYSRLGLLRAGITRVHHC